MIWCVEDDTNILDIELCALEFGGFQARGFEDGASFFEALKKEKPQLIILDIMLPHMDGIEILTRLKETMEYKNIPVIMASAKGQEYDKVKGLNLGADDYVVKPYVLPILIARMEAVFRRSKRPEDKPSIKNVTIGQNNQKLSLTKREKDVLLLVTKGESNKSIADKLVLSEITVKTHLNSVFKKLRVTNRTQAVLRAIQLNLVEK